jgi:hypothetical protein
MLGNMIINPLVDQHHELIAADYNHRLLPPIETFWLMMEESYLAYLGNLMSPFRLPVVVEPNQLPLSPKRPNQFPLSPKRPNQFPLSPKRPNSLEAILGALWHPVLTSDFSLFGSC